ncbi:hypothetical protein N0V85_000060 [Neurospora sp. IMI 360204]|nr:hypothetical protein N0V85_000060 [Neurospora sp. IMI 360204]
MAKGIFFMSWELWQQMTFFKALAVAILAVFCAGLVKLWWTNRIVRKQEILDEEKKARIDDMRSTGLRPTSSKRAAASTIPFGVRAIQSGVQVDGIWISGPATPTETTKLTSAATLVNLDAEQQRREKTKATGVTTTTLQRLTDSDSLESNSSGAIPPPTSRFTAEDKRHYYPQRQGLRAPHALNEDTLRRLEGQDGGAQPQRPAVYDIYVPTTSSRRQQEVRGGHDGDPARGSQRSTGSESGDSSTDSAQQRFTRSGSGRSYSSSSGGGGGGGEGGKTYGPRGVERRDPVRDPFGTPPSHVMYQQQQQQQEEAEPMMIPAPEPTFGPGDLHFTNNRSAARRVNDGFEVLPVGRLGTPGTEPRVNHYHLNGLEREEEGGEETGQARGSRVPGYGRR